MTTDWFENDALFRKELVEGHKWAAMVADRLNDAGIPAELTPMAWRQSIDDRYEFADEVDIVVETRAGTLAIESKSRNLHFTEDPSSFPYSTALVDTVYSWDRKITKRFAVVIVSQQTEQMLVVPPNSSRAEWTVKEGYDRVRNIPDRWYEVPTRFLVPFQQLVDAIFLRL